LRTAILVAVVTLLAPVLHADETGVPSSPQLLLNAQRLRRLSRDRQRQTVRWINFETRVQNVPDSPERGFELALYYAVTKEEARGREALVWARAHPCDRRQAALVIDWVTQLVSEEDRRQLVGAVCPAGNSRQIPSVRDRLFWSVANGKGGDPFPPEDSHRVLASLKEGGFANPSDLYAACEFLLVLRTSQHVALREEAPQFFAQLPIEFLLSLPPAQVEHPDWHVHAAALSLVGLDTNLESSQFLQGWAMEDRQTIAEGPGVAYELLWADPYLPGIGYQNLDPWVYDPAGRLYARSDWTPDSCWIAITRKGVQSENCPGGWQSKAFSTGHLTLVPVSEICTEIPSRKPDNAYVLWKLHPNQPITFRENDRQASVQADPAGLWRVRQDVDGKICTVLPKR
jgi:hypothetical protein